MRVKKKSLKKSNKKLLFLIIIVFAAAFLIGTITKTSKKEASLQKKNLLCDHLIADCLTPVQNKIPKGVCAPGGKCT